MRGRSLVPWMLCIPLVMGVGIARAADQQPAAATFKIMLSDGGTVAGAVSFVISLDTQYGVIKIPSSSMVSARFDATREWADIRLSEAQLKLKYKPGSSDIKAATSAGALNIELSKVLTIDNGTVPPPTAAAPNAIVPPPAYAQQPPQVITAPPAAYPYAQPPYYSIPPYYYSTPQYVPEYVPEYAPDDSYGFGAPYIWPYGGFGIVVGPGFWGGYGFRGGYGHGGYGGGGHGGGGHGGGGHR